MTNGMRIASPIQAGLRDGDLYHSHASVLTISALAPQQCVCLGRGVATRRGCGRKVAGMQSTGTKRSQQSKLISSVSRHYLYVCVALNFIACHISAGVCERPEATQMLHHSEPRAKLLTARIEMTGGFAFYGGQSTRASHLEGSLIRLAKHLQLLAVHNQSGRSAVR